jgi:hypothetical protein
MINAGRGKRVFGGGKRVQGRGKRGEEEGRAIVRSIWHSAGRDPAGRKAAERS